MALRFLVQILASLLLLSTVVSAQAKELLQLQSPLKTPLPAPTPVKALPPVAPVPVKAPPAQTPAPVKASPPPPAPAPAPEVKPPIFTPPFKAPIVLPPPTSAHPPPPRNTKAISVSAQMSPSSAPAPSTDAAVGLISVESMFVGVVGVAISLFVLKEIV
ncbi:hypothetical protein AgCh_008063 [Apium graveolens]